MVDQVLSLFDLPIIECSEIYDCCGPNCGLDRFNYPDRFESSVHLARTLFSVFVFVRVVKMLDIASDLPIISVCGPF